MTWCDGFGGAAAPTLQMPALAHALDGSEDAVPASLPSFDEVYVAHVAFVWRTLRTFGVADAQLEDAVQDVFVVVHRRLPEWEGRAQLTTWLFAIARRVASSQRRKAGNARTEPMVDEPLHGYLGSALSTGSTHFVAFVAEIPNDEELHRVGPLIENDPLFPERTSVIFAKEIGVRLLQIRIWERGVGETLGCGTGSSAAAAEWMRRHARSGDVEVQNPGGVLIVSADSVGGSLVTQSKPVETYSGDVKLSVPQHV